MLWDMIRYANFDVNSPYNREAAGWTRMQDDYRLPVDPRPIRDNLANAKPELPKPPEARIVPPHTVSGPAAAVAAAVHPTAPNDGILFIDDEVIVAEPVDDEPDILIID
jgi:hypothetical protein